MKNLRLFIFGLGLSQALPALGIRSNLGEIFLELFNRSLTAGWLILAVIVLRFLFRKTPKWMFCALWGIVAIRLLLPGSLESVLSLVPVSEPNHTAISGQVPYIQSGVNLVDHTANTYLAEFYYDDMGAIQQVSVTNPIDILAIVWLVGMLVLIAYGVVSYVRLKRSVDASVCLRKNIMECDEISYPFILGMIRPLIYLPSTLTEASKEYVITHELAHIRRHDHWWKPIGFLILAIYWFNPLCWISYILLCRDIELATDEKVIKDMGKEEKAGYSQTLLDIGRTRRRIAVCPLAFGEVGVKERVKGVLHYKKPSFWIVMVSTIACIAVFICFFTTPKENPAQPDSEKEDTIVGSETISETTKEDTGEEVQSADDYADELRIVSDRKEVLKEYICEQIGFGGIFTLLLYEDGTFSYYEGSLSSYFGDGDWLFEDGKLTLLDRGTGKIRKAVFDYKKGELTYNQQESDQYPFTYVILEDGKRFIPMEKADEKFHQDLEQQLTDQEEERRQRVLEASKDSPLNHQTLKKFWGQDMEATLYIDTWEHHLDATKPIEIYIRNRSDKVLWQSQMGIAPTEQKSFYIYSEVGTDYVIEYHPLEMDGQIAYTFKMFTFGEEGEEFVKCEYAANSEAEKEEFLQNIELYLKRARFLVSTMGGEIRFKEN